MERKKLKVLNLYAGIGGNRKLWPNEEIEVTAVENNPEIAKIYQDFFPNDKVVVGDAHQYLLEHYKEFDFIWSSPPCPTHSRINFSYGKKIKRKFPDMKLYEEIIFLQTWFKGKYVVENVVSYYKPLIKPQELQKHYFWSNFNLGGEIGERIKVRNDPGETSEFKMKAKDMVIKDFHGYKGDKRTLLNNAIEGTLGLHIFNMAFKEPQRTLSWVKLNKIAFEYNAIAKEIFNMSYYDLESHQKRTVMNKYRERY